MKDKGERKAVFLPQDLYRKVEERARASECSSVDEYVGSVLEEIVREEDKGEPSSQEEEEEVKKRLRALGYLN